MSVRILKAGTPRARSFIEAMLARRGGLDEPRVNAAVSKIIVDVRRRGDRALIDYTRKFDGVRLTARTLR
ncbi:MAG TPA: histidinol dehydrogenase, partial [Candidatus Binataceae bacterium]|nr:histidinol dehydrogenase [Candidatus Binataceae bacterium]